MTKFGLRQVFVLNVSLLAVTLFSACSQEQDSAHGPNRGAIGSRLASITIPVPPALNPFVGPDKINSLRLRIAPQDCRDGVVGTSVDKFVPDFVNAAGFLASEKVRIGCNYSLGISLGRSSGVGSGFDQIFLTNDTSSLLTRIQAKDTADEKIRVAVRVYPTQDGKNILGLPGDPIDALSDHSTSQNPGGGSQQNQQPLSRNWKVVLMASDQGNQSAWIPVFDNARNWLFRYFETRGIVAANIRQLSLKPQFQNQQVQPATAQNFASAVASLNATGANDACLIHMTSHGSRDGFNLGSSRLSPGALGSALDAGCGSKPTVVLVSACFSGLYVLDSSGIKKPNRVILTAARNDRTSFGCSSEYEYTYWDSCLIENLPKSTRFKDLAANIQSCIAAKESGMSTPSLPQAFIGADVQDLPLPGST